LSPDLQLLRGVSLMQRLSVVLRAYVDEKARFTSRTKEIIASVNRIHVG